VYAQPIGELYLRGPLRLTQVRERHGGLHRSSALIHTLDTPRIIIATLDLTPWSRPSRHAP
jgi:hypothetical protein